MASLDSWPYLIATLLNMFQYTVHIYAIYRVYRTLFILEIIYMPVP